MNNDNGNGSPTKKLAYLDDDGWVKASPRLVIAVLIFAIGYGPAATAFTNRWIGGGSGSESEMASLRELREINMSIKTISEEVKTMGKQVEANRVDVQWLKREVPVVGTEGR